MKPYTIGLTMHVKPDGDLGLFENGLKQNVQYLFKLFKSSPNCKKALLITTSRVLPIIPDWLELDRSEIVVMEDGASEVDFLVGIGTAIDKPHIETVRKRGGKTIAYKGGNGAVMNMEALGSNGYHGGKHGEGSESYYDFDSFDQVWITPQHSHTGKSWYETIYKCPVHVVPQVWSPEIIEATKTAGFGWKRPTEGWRIASFDPNNTVMKTSHWPMLICENAFRQNPEAFKAFYITNTTQFVENSAFKSFALALTSAHARNPADTGSVMSFERRYLTSQYLGENCDAVVTHQWENELNYLYYDVLWGGYPLIHNSQALKQYGYFYPSFNAQAGAEALLRAVEKHRGKRPMGLFESLSPTNPDLRAVHERLLEQA